MKQKKGVLETSFNHDTPAHQFVRVCFCWVRLEFFRSMQLVQCLPGFGYLLWVSACGMYLCEIYGVELD